MEKLINDLDNKISKAQNITGNLFNDLEEIRNSFNNLKAAINYTHSCKSDSEQFSFADMRDAFDYASVSSQRRDGYTFKEWISKR